MSTSLRAERALSVRSPAIPLFTGQPALVPLKLEGTEGVNSLFHYTLTLQMPDTLAHSGTGSNFDLDSFIGLEITCSIELDGMGSFQPGMPGDHGTTHQGAGVREISGLITAARFVREDHRHAVYELELRPWLYLTTLTTDCRVFQDKTAVEVIEEVLAPYSYAADKRLSERHPPKDYCVQFNETTFEFIIGVAKAGDMTHCPRCKGDYAILPTPHAATEEGITLAFEGTATACGATLIASFTR